MRLGFGIDWGELVQRTVNEQPLEQPVMYLPNSFRIEDPAWIHQLIEAHSFGLLISSVSGLCANPLPFQLLKGVDGAPDRLVGHMARANGQWKDLATGMEVLVAFQGPHAFVSPEAYPEPRSHVPTWNYTAVQAYGKPRLLDMQELAGVLATAVAFYEGPTSDSWQGLREDVRQSKVLAIVGFEICVSRYEAKAKLSQNRNHEEKTGVIQWLSQSTEPNALAIASAMLALT